MAVHYYYPEMHELKPQGCSIQVVSTSARHYYLRSDLELSGRGIEITDALSHGWRYKVTDKAFKLLATKYDIVEELLLD